MLYLIKPPRSIFLFMLCPESRHHEIRDSSRKHQKSDQPTNKSLLRRGKHLIDLLLEGRLGRDIGVNRVFRVFQTDIPLLTNNLDRMDHIALPERLDCSFGKI
jgi:hypothetical protein